MVKNKKNKRSCIVHLDPSNYDEFDGLAIDLENQKILGQKGGQLFPLLGEAKLEYTRERANKGPKVLHSSSSPSNEAWMNSNHQLLGYDHLIAVDTNTNHLNGSDVSITAAFHIIPEGRNNEEAFCKSGILALVEFWNAEEKPENVGWWLILQALEANADHYSGKVALIVDSDLGNHEVFNKREKPLVGDFFLPEEVTIIYGSDKGGPEHLSTKMIKYCHDLASDVFKEQNLVMLVKNLRPGVEGYFSHFRQWDINQEGLRRFFG